MKSLWRRILVAVLVAEAAPILLLVVFVALFGPGAPAADEGFASMHGQWIGPLGGAIATFLVACWAATPLSKNHLGCGALIGGLVAAFDVSILIASGEPFRMLFGVSAAGRLIAGLFGGVAAQALADKHGKENQ